MAGKFNSNSAGTVASAGTPVQLTATNIPTPAIFIQAAESNSGYIYVGLSDVSSSKCLLALAAGDGATLRGDRRETGTEELVCSDYWVDASASAQGFRWSYQGKR